MKLKFGLLCICAILLSGCSIEYNAYFNESNVEEKITSTGISFSTFPVPSFIDAQGASEENVMIDGVEYYNIVSDYDIIKFDYKFGIKDYTRSTAINSCLKSVKINNNNGQYILNSSAYFNCFDAYPLIDNITINLFFDMDYYNIINNNADSISNNVYTWNINKDNYKNKNIQVIYSEKGNKLNKEDNKEKQNENESALKKWVNDNLALVFVGVFIILALIIGLAILLKKNKF